MKTIKWVQLKKQEMVTKQQIIIALQGAGEEKELTSDGLIIEYLFDRQADAILKLFSPQPAIESKNSDTMLDFINEEIKKGNPDQYTLNRLWHRCTELSEQPSQEQAQPEQVNSVTNCPTCSSKVRVRGEGETHFYIPIEAQEDKWTWKEFHEEMSKLFPNSKQDIAETFYLMENYNPPTPKQ